MDQRIPVAQVITALRRVRVRQGENGVALLALAQQAELLIGEDRFVSKTAIDIKNDALQLRRAGESVPRFVVEDLLEESIARLQQAEILAAGLR